MPANRPPLTVSGRSVGVAVLVAAQVLVGFTHLFFGFWMLSAPEFSIFGFSSTYLTAFIYSVYTVVFSVLTLIFVAGIWLQKSWGWAGTAAVSVFVIIADSLTLLDLPSVPGIPKFAGFGEITYSIMVLVFLLLPRVRGSYKIGSGKEIQR